MAADQCLRFKTSVLRSTSAPPFNVPKKTLSSSRAHTDMQLSGWHTSITGLHQDVYNSSHSLQMSKNLKSQNNNKNEKFKSRKWYLKGKESSVPHPEFIFHHYTDTNKYMEEYREIKLNKIRQKYKNSYVNPLSIDEANKVRSHEMNLEKYYSVEPKSYNFQDSTSQITTYRDVNCFSSPTNDSIDKLASKESCRKNDFMNYTYQNISKHNRPKSEKKMPVTLPKFNGCFLPNPSITHPHTFEPDFFLQCRKFKDLPVRNTTESDRKANYHLTKVVH